jgi:hypothetical protein
MVFGTCRAQRTELPEPIVTTSLISLMPRVSGGGMIGFCQEWSRLSLHFSKFTSLDFYTHPHAFQTTAGDYNAWFSRSGARYYYKTGNSGFFHSAALLLGYEQRPLPAKSAISAALGVTVVGYRLLLKGKFIVELDAFFAAGIAQLRPYDQAPFLSARYFPLVTLRFGYRFGPID